MIRTKIVLDGEPNFRISSVMDEAGLESQTWITLGIPTETIIDSRAAGLPLRQKLITGFEKFLEENNI